MGELRYSSIIHDLGAVCVWSASRPGHFTPGERGPGTHKIGGWVGPRAAVDAVEKRKILPLLGIEPRPCPARSPSLYRLSYADYCVFIYLLVMFRRWRPSLPLKKTPWRWSASELCRPRDRRLLAK
jgi:hypothetical protein